jgi:hypothetical protein
LGLVALGKWIPILATLNRFSNIKYPPNATVVEILKSKK